MFERMVRPTRNRVSFEVPEEYSRYVCKVVLFPFKEKEKPKYDFSDIVGKLRWKGDAVKEQRALRDEW